MKFLIILCCTLVARIAGDVSHLLSNQYLPPSQQYAASAPAVSFSAAPVSYNFGAASAPAVSYSAPVDQSYHVEAASAPDVVYSSPATQSYHVEADSAPATVSYEVAASEPAHTFSASDGYRYKTAKRRVIRRYRRDVSHLSNEYLPPHQSAASAPSGEYLPPLAASAPIAQFESAPSYSVAASAPAISYSAPASQSYQVAASGPAISYSAEASAPSFSYSAPAASYESYDTAASEPAHSFSSAEGYRYKTARRRVIRRQRRDVSHLSNEYLPPVAASVTQPQYDFAPSYNVAASEPTVEYSTPAASYESTSYEAAASEPAHSFSSADGYRYKTARRRVIRRQRRDVSHLSSEYLPPVAASAPVAQYESTPYYAEAASAPSIVYSSPGDSYGSASYEAAASEPSHYYSSGEGYRYKTAKRRVIRRHRF